MLQSMGSQRVGRDLATEKQQFIKQSFWKSENITAKEKNLEELADTISPLPLQNCISYGSAMNKINLLILISPDIMIQIFQENQGSEVCGGCVCVCFSGMIRELNSHLP